MNDVLRWLFAPAVTLSPMALLGVLLIHGVLRDAIVRKLRRRAAEVVDLPNGGSVTLFGLSDAELAMVVERTGGTLRPKGWLR